MALTVKWRPCSISVQLLQTAVSQSRQKNLRVCPAKFKQKQNLSLNKFGPLKLNNKITVLDFPLNKIYKCT